MKANFWTQVGFAGAAGAGGYGNPAYLNGGCFQPNTATTSAAAFNSPIAAGLASCTANVQDTQEISVGFWQQLYKGDLGQVRLGAQYEFVRLKAFAGTGVPPAGRRR